MVALNLFSVNRQKGFGFVDLLSVEFGHQAWSALFVEWNSGGIEAVMVLGVWCYVR